DLPAARQMAGLPSFATIKFFCSFCTLTLHEIDNLDMARWGERRAEIHLHWARAWRDAASEKERDDIFEAHGARWSELLRLKYWNPFKHLMLDAAHALFLGALQRHCRQIWGMDVRLTDGDGLEFRPSTRGHVIPPTPEQMDFAVKVFRQGTKTRLNKLGVALLQAVADYYSIPYRGNKKQDMEKYTKARQVLTQARKTAVLGKETLHEVWSDMQKTVLPSWIAPAPRNVGDGRHGKLTADQWRTLCTVHLVITLVRMWGPTAPAERSHKILDNYMHMVAGVKLATMRSTSPQKASQFVQHWLQYLHGVLDLYPGSNLSPNQHLAAHLGPQMVWAGPSHSLWTFIFERLNKLLRDIPTNNRIG
ncbi:hypothetical protein PHLGIDRAFT_42332, partial [Phlebiopsis gigantea 11061_1 CR5-6]